MNIYVAVQVKRRMWELCNIAPQITCANLSCEGTDLRTATISKTHEHSEAYKGSFFTSKKRLIDVDMRKKRNFQRQV